MPQRKSSISSLLSGAWRLLDTSRRVVLNLLFLALLFLLLALAVAEESTPIPETTALVVAPEGNIVEQLSGDPTQRAVARLMGTVEPETVLKELLDAIATAQEDDRVAVLFLDLNRMGGAGPSKLRELRSAVDSFRQTGKKVLAAADFYPRSRYYLATAADEVYLHRMGLVFLDGYGVFRTYYKDLLDRFEVEWNVFRAGEYKSAVEPYQRNDMSEEAREANLDWLGDLWHSYLADVSAARGLRQSDVETYVERFAENLTAAAGQASSVALAAGLVDHVGDRDQVRDRLIELVGEDEESRSFHHIDHRDYLRATRQSHWGRDSSKDVVGVVVAAGSILDGSHPPGLVGGDSTAKLVRQARHDEEVKAVVLRVDSPGGSAFAAEVIRRELELLRRAGKPVVVSMGSVAASGGYLIATASDEIWASPDTITGSIGVYGMFPTFQAPLAKHLGIRVDGVGTTWLSGALRPDRKLSPQVAHSLQLMVDQTYRGFLEKVAAARGTTPEAVDEIAQGRVWSGADAHRLGLLDRLGNLEDAIASAAALAGLSDGYRVMYLEQEPSLGARLAATLLSRIAAVVAREVEWNPPRSFRLALLEALERQTERLARFNDPFGVYAYCPCELD